MSLEMAHMNEMQTSLLQFITHLLFLIMQVLWWLIDISQGTSLLLYRGHVLQYSVVPLPEICRPVFQHNSSFIRHIPSVTSQCISEHCVMCCQYHRPGVTTTHRDDGTRHGLLGCGQRRRQLTYLSVCFCSLCQGAVVWRGWKDQESSNLPIRLILIVVFSHKICSQSLISCIWLFFLLIFFMVWWCFWSLFYNITLTSVQTSVQYITHSICNLISFKINGTSILSYMLVAQSIVIVSMALNVF